MVMRHMKVFILFMMGHCMAGYAQDFDKLQKMIDSIPFHVVNLKEPRFQVNIHGGYSYGIGSTFRFYPDDIHSITIEKTGNGAPVTTTQYRYNYKRLGAGIRFGGGLSYIINDFINVGMDVDYLQSIIFKTRDSNYYQYKIPGSPGQTGIYNYRANGKITYNAIFINFSPYITFKAISRSKWYLYNKIGAVFTYQPKNTEEDVTDIRIRRTAQGVLVDSFMNVVKKSDWQIKNPSYGVMAAIGLQVKAGSRIRVFGELQFAHIIAEITKKTLTQYSISEKDLLPTLSLSQRETSYVRNFTSFGQDPDKPTQMLIERMPVTYLSAQAGIAFQLR